VPQTNENDQKDSSALSRTERKKKERTRKLLQTAAEVFAKKGYDNTSLEDIAEQMDMRAPSLYHYVKTKEELFMRCADVMVASVFKNLEQASKISGCPMQRLENMLYVQILGQLRDFYPNHIPLFVRVTSHEPALKKCVKNISKYLLMWRKKRPLPVKLSNNNGRSDCVWFLVLLDPCTNGIGRMVGWRLKTWRAISPSCYCAC